MRRTIERVRAEFMEMPGMRLTAAQVVRLCGVERTICNGALDALVNAKFLRLSPDGTYSRLTDGQPAAVDLERRRRRTAQPDCLNRSPAIGCSTSD